MDNRLSRSVPTPAIANSAAYIDAYEAAGLDPSSLPPRQIADLVKELSLCLHQRAAARA